MNKALVSEALEESMLVGPDGEGADQGGTGEAKSAAPLIGASPVGGPAVGLGVAVVVVAVLMALSLAIGSNPLSLGEVWQALIGDDTGQAATVVRELRLPRTLIGVAVGAALGLAGALMQALTHNPLADPGILGVNAGAAAAIVVAIGVLGLTGLSQFVWFAFVGAAAAAVVVYLLASGGGLATPVRLALAGTAVTFALSAFTQSIVVLDPAAFDQFRFWAVGSLEGRSFEVLRQVAPFLLVGVGLAAVVARSLNVLALGDDTGRALGARPNRTRLAGACSITLLCGASTAAVGPIAFVGLTVPHVARYLVGSDQRWILAYSTVLAPALLLSADIVGRVLARPGEIEVGIVTAVIGGPVFISIVRRRRLAAG